MRKERKSVLEIEGQGKVRVKGYKQRFLKIGFLENHSYLMAMLGFRPIVKYSSNTILLGP